MEIMKKQEYFDKINEDKDLRNEVLKKYSDEIKGIVSLIKMRDKMKNLDADEDDGVVDTECLDLPILAALVDAHYHGMFNEHSRSKKWTVEEFIEGLHRYWTETHSGPAHNSNMIEWFEKNFI